MRNWGSERELICQGHTTCLLAEQGFEPKLLAIEPGDDPWQLTIYLLQSSFSRPTLCDLVEHPSSLSLVCCESQSLSFHLAWCWSSRLSCSFWYGGMVDQQMWRGWFWVARELSCKTTNKWVLRAVLCSFCCVAFILRKSLTVVAQASLELTVLLTQPLKY